MTHIFHPKKEGTKGDDVFLITALVHEPHNTCDDENQKWLTWLPYHRDRGDFVDNKPVVVRTATTNVTMNRIRCNELQS